MSNVPANYLQQVQTFQYEQLALLQNYSPFISQANTSLSEFSKLAAQLGSTVTFSRPSRFVSQEGLNVAFQPATQLVQSLTVDKQKNASYAFTSQQLIFNAEEYIAEFGRAAVEQLATTVEGDVATLCETTPYRFFGDGRTQISSFTQLAQLIAQYKAFGAPGRGMLQGYLHNLAVPQIIGSGLNQFVLDRNEEIANSWMVGNFKDVSWAESNLLPTHRSGSTGNLNQTLTVVSTNDPTGANITAITVSGASATDTGAVKQYDSFQFNSVNFRTYIGQLDAGIRAQFQASADSSSNGGGQVTIQLSNPLCSQAGNPNQNISENIVAGMTIQTYPDHRCGLLVGANTLYLATPQLPDMYPYPTSSRADERSKISSRLYYGGMPFTGQVGYVNDIIWGKTAVSDYVMKIMFPA